jgi:hypothetical protein
MSQHRYQKSREPTGEINPDGVQINVLWADFPIGASVFIPAINIMKLVRQMRKAANLRKMHLQWAERIESGKLGARFWRVL